MNKKDYITTLPKRGLTLSYPGGVKYAPLLFFVHHPKTAQGIKLKLSDFKDTLLRHMLQQNWQQNYRRYLAGFGSTEK